MNEYGVERIAVDSSNLQAVGYDEVNQILYVEFKSNTLYRYQGVPIAVYNDLLNASSKGSYFYQNIRRANYPYEQLA
jgi:hypothetical protein